MANAATTKTLAKSKPRRRPIRVDTPAANRLVVADGTLEAVKWLGLALMVLDHVNKYLLDERSAVLFDLGRMVMPLFGFVLMTNLARPGAMASGMHGRVALRLLAFGVAATPVYVALVGWWPANILFLLALATAVVWLVEGGGPGRLALAALAFLVGGAFVEFWWFGLLACLGAWAYSRHPSPGRLALWALALASLWVVNRNFAALAVLPLVWGATQVKIPVKRRRWIFYVFYPAHLTAIWLVLRLA